MSNPYQPQQPGQQPGQPGAYPQQQPGVPPQGNYPGQQPPQQGGYPGQQPPQGAFPQQQPYPNPGYASQPPKRGMSAKLKRSLISIGVLVVIGGGLFAYNAYKSKDSATKAGVGDCVTSSSSNPKIVSCNASNAAFKVADKFDNTTDTTKCDAQDEQNKGVVAGFYWSGDGKGLLCVTVTAHTTLNDFTDMGGATQDQLDAARKAVGLPPTGGSSPSDSSTDNSTDNSSDSSAPDPSNS